MSQNSGLASDAGSLWLHCRSPFLQTIEGQSPEIVQEYIDQCSAALLTQGVPWDIVTVVRNRMQLCAPTTFQPKKLVFSMEERKTPPPSPEIGARGDSNPGSSPILPELVRVEFTGADWERAKGKIRSYNKQLEKQRQKSARSGKSINLVQISTPYIRYRELGPVEP